MVIWTPYHVNSAQRKVFLQEVFYSFIGPVELGIWFELDFICYSLFLVNKFFQISVPDELIKKKLQSSAILSFVPLLFVKGTLPPLIAPFGVPSHLVGLLEVRLVSNSGEELVDWFLKNHIDPLPYPVLIINRAFLLPFECPFVPRSCPYISFHLPDVIL